MKILGEERVELTLPGSPPYVGVLRTLISGVGREMGIDDEVVGEVGLALSEACNHVLHTLGTHTVLELRCTLSAEGVQVRMLGRPRANLLVSERRRVDFDVPLMEALMDSVEISQSDVGMEIQLRRRFEKPTSR